MGGKEPTVRKFVDGTEVKTDGTEVTCPVYSKNFAMRDMSFDLARAVWLQHLQRKFDCFEIPSLEPQETFSNAVLILQCSLLTTVRRLRLQLQTWMTLLMIYMSGTWMVLSD